MNITHTSVLLVLVGYVIHLYLLKRKIEGVKGERIRWRWLWNNRRPKLISALLSALAFGYVCYIYFNPSELIKTGDHEALAMFYGWEIIIGILNSVLIEYAVGFGIKSVGAQGVSVIDLDDDGKTRYPIK